MATAPFSKSGTRHRHISTIPKPSRPRDRYSQGLLDDTSRQTKDDDSEPKQQFSECGFQLERNAASHHSIPVTSSTRVVLRIYGKSKLVPGVHTLISEHSKSVAELLNLRDSNDNLIRLPVKASGSQLTLKLDVQELTGAAFLQQIEAAKGTPEPECDDKLSHIVHKLVVISRIAVTIAQLHPIAAAVTVILSAVIEIMELRVKTDDTSRELVEDVDRSLTFVTSVELLTKLPAHETLVSNVLAFLISPRSQPKAKRLQSALNNRVLCLNNELTASNLSATRGLEQDIGRIDGNIAILERVPRWESGHLRRVIISSLSLESNKDWRIDGNVSRLSEIVEWAEATPLDSTPTVFWISGSACSGKSTLATTLADILIFERKHLGAFVFFNRDVEERTNPSAMIHTMAHRLARFSPDIRHEIAQVFEEDPDIIHQSLRVQFDRLLLKPFLALAGHCKPVILIIDALDEAAKGPIRDEFLSTLASGLSKFPPFVRVIITSRRDGDISRYLSMVPFVQEHDLNATAGVDDDIRLYITACLREVQQNLDHDLPPAWPTEIQIHQLVERATGLFIWASVACTYIGAVDPISCIAELCDSTAYRHADRSLDRLYDKTLTAAGQWEMLAFAANVHKILSAVIMTRNPLSSTSIAELFQIPLTVVSKVVSNLCSVLMVESGGNIRIVHPSFADYLTNGNRCSPNAPWFLDETAGNYLLASKSLHLLGRQLHYNLANLDTTANFKPGPIPSHYIWVTPPYPCSQALEYAAINWIDHALCLEPLGFFQKLHGEMTKFYSSCLLEWIELLSLIKHSRDIIPKVRKLHMWCLESNETSPEGSLLSHLVYDTWRLLNAFSHTIELHPLLVHETVLPFMPKNTQLRKCWGKNNPPSLQPMLAFQTLGTPVCCPFTSTESLSTPLSFTLPAITLLLQPALMVQSVYGTGRLGPRLSQTLGHTGKDIA
ncbi:hypothetical protein FB45DRAFT_1009100 [Roridomyces roridus]|uniref:Nephrocystin 3-like N-terminal domain-containing protein n=1 Tax=Roridomyces roridus TaxID=1738132 RepID=A0AAD7B8K2_9AGAR|nr:hypothetical protein FB45DRAFT_1009100 [Roridomyces roridus]